MRREESTWEWFWSDNFSLWLVRFFIISCIILLSDYVIIT